MRFHEKIYLQHGVEKNDDNQGVQFLFGQNLNSLQIGHAYLEVEIRDRKADITDFILASDNTNKVIRLVNNAFASTIHDARISTSFGTEIELNEFVGPRSTILRFLTQRDGGLSTYFDITYENEDDMNNSLIKEILINNHKHVNRGALRGYSLLELIFGFCESFKKLAKALVFNSTSKHQTESEIISML